MSGGGVYWRHRKLTTSAANSLLLAFFDKEKHKIKRVVLDSNQLDAVPAALRLLTNMTQLFLRDNHIAYLPEWIGTMTALEELELNGNKLCTIPGSIGNLSNLAVLSLGNNDLASIPRSVGNLTKLNSLTLCNNRLLSVPSSLRKLKYLKHIDLETNPLLPSHIQQRAALSWDRNYLAVPAFLDEIALEEWRRHARAAAIAWILVGKTMRLHRDMVGVIAKLIYGTRTEDVWEIEN